MAELRLVFQPAPDTTMTVRVDFSSADSDMRSGGQPQPFTFQLALVPFDVRHARTILLDDTAV